MIKIDEHDTSWEIACMLINATHTVHNRFSGKDYEEQMFDLEDLRKIGEHLINYVNTEQEEECNE